MPRPHWLRPLSLIVCLLLVACANRKAAGTREDSSGGTSGGEAAAPPDEEVRMRADSMLEGDLAAARAATAEARHADAVEAYRRIDALLERSEALGVDLKRPDGYEKERAEAFAALRARVLDEARASTASGDTKRAQECWMQALALEPTDAERAEIERAGSELLLARAQTELDSGRAREAYEAAVEALDALPTADEELRSRLVALRDQAYARAAVRVALLPPWRTRKAARRMVDSNRFLHTLDDELHLRMAAASGAFVTLADPAGIHDTWHRMQYDGDDATPLRAAGVAALYGGHIAVTLLLDRTRTGDSIDSDSRTVRRKDGGSERYTLRTTTLHMSARCRLRLIDVATRLILSEQEIESEAQITGYVAVYKGDLAVLDLNKAEQEWFDPGQPTRLEIEVRQATARKLAEDITTAVLAWLPRRSG